MNSKKYMIVIISVILLLVYSGCSNKTVSVSDGNEKVTEILPGEHWWGGAVTDGRNSPLNIDNFTYDQLADTKGNQAAPFFLSDKGRIIWSEKPLNIRFEGKKIAVKSYGGDVMMEKAGDNLRDAYLYGSRHFFPSSGKTPDPLMFTSPQYNTWIELQYNQNEQDILKYSLNISANGFPSGVIMIDDNWQEKYGTWRFDCQKFQDPQGMMKKLHSEGFKVMLWVVPFISPDSPVFRELDGKKALIFADSSKNKPAVVEWWNGYSALADLSNPAGFSWFRGQLAELVRVYGVDGFKFDAGDPESYRGKGSFKILTPNDHCEAYVKLGLEFPLNEFRACWKMAGQPLGQRLRDKSHSWDDLRVLIPDMIALGLIGHQFGCPDMIGGGEWTSFQDSSILDEELIVRSSQVSALMPMMQFSVAPWRVLNKENLAICRDMAILHHKMGAEIFEMAASAAATGEPMVRNLEYEYPGKGYEQIKDQFILGGKIMVAPVVSKGARSREVTFPEGKWEGDDSTIVRGPAVLKIDVPLSRLPWFRKLEQ
jgi:alpha-glucosidase (family GH31 glycosyl hydrolase)